MTISNSITINLPVADVFTFFKNTQNYTRFSTVFKKVELLSGNEISLGARVLKTAEFLGMEQSVEQEVVKFDVLKMIIFKNISGPVSGTETLFFKKLSENSTELTVTLDGEPSGFLKFGASLLKNKAERELADGLLNVKQLLEK
jgi:uncharacterized membrane protein